MSTVTIYTSPGCTACYAAKLRMRRAGIEFEEVDLATNLGALAYVRDELGHRQAPVTVRTGPSGQMDHWSGFRMEKIRQLATEQHTHQAHVQATTEGPGTGRCAQVPVEAMHGHQRPGSITPDVA